MPIQVFVADEQSDQPVEPGRWGELAERVLGDLTGTGSGAGSEMELNILFVDSATIASMNRRFLGRSGPTDVLSFPIEDDVLGAAGLGPPGSMAPGGSGPGRWEDDDVASAGGGGSGPARWSDEGGGEDAFGFGTGAAAAGAPEGGAVAPLEEGTAAGGGGGASGFGGGGAMAGLPTLLGDVVICPAVAAANAADHAAGLPDELALLVVHGILHLCGMDHENDDEATEMEALEQVLLDRHFRGVRA